MDENWVLPVINEDLCTSCSLCVDYCPTGAVGMVEDRPVILSPANCSYCGICEDLCPEGAVELTYEIQ